MTPVIAEEFLCFYTQFPQRLSLDGKSVRKASEKDFTPIPEKLTGTHYHFS